jgi:hypothetical protein
LRRRGGAGVEEEVDVGGEREVDGGLQRTTSIKR